ncbi:NAAT family transporter [Candidatus Sumerlaeota bacterium]|nr:NAAT family transporter [Candidatus Sumerlaeota bacterium]
MSTPTDIDFLLRATVSLISIIDPLGAIPLLLSLTRNRGAVEMKQIVRTTTIACAVALICFALAGSAILDFFHISVPAFRASGGILILLMAVQMMSGEVRRSKHTPEEEAEAAEKENIAVVPLAIPLLVGPGAMSTAVLLSKEANNWHLKASLLTAIAITVAVTWVSLRMSDLLRRVLGETGIRIATRVMGLILAAIAVQFIADGARDLFPILKD